VTSARRRDIGPGRPIDPVLTDGIRAALRPPPGPIIDLPDSVTFAEHRSFVGDGGAGLFPKQRTFLRLIHLETDLFTPYDEDTIGSMAEGYYSGEYRWGLQPDVRRRIEILKERGRSHFGTVLFIGGRRGGKGHIGALIAAKQMHGLIAMDDPQARYGIAAGKQLRSLITATTYPQARDNQFADLFHLLTWGACFKYHLAEASKNRVTLWTPADRRRVAELGRRDRRLALEQASIRASAIAPNASGARGSACTCLVFDEFAHSLEGTDSVRTGEEVYRALVPSLGQVHPDGIVYLPTSPWTKETHCYRLYEMALEVDEDGEPRYPDILLIHQPSWGGYEDAFDPVATEGRVFVSVPMAPDERVAQQQESDPESYGVEILAQWREVEEGFLNPRMVESMFGPFCSKCGMPTPDTVSCDLCGGEPREITEVEHGIFAFGYRGHADPGWKSANFAYLFAHTEEFITAEGETWSHVIVDRVRVFKPEDFPNRTIPYDRVEEELVADLMRFATMTVFSFDQFASLATLPKLRERLGIAGHRARVREVTFTESSNRERAYTSKAAISLGWVHCIRDNYGPQGRSLLELELKSLKLKGDRVVAPTGGPIRTKDAADCLMVLVDELLKDQLKRRPNRERLSSARLAAGAQGGYRSGAAAAEGRLVRQPPRQVLATHGRRRQSGFPYGALDPTRRQYLVDDAPSAARRRGRPKLP
jgi:hypothetical protein